MGTRRSMLCRGLLVAMLIQPATVFAQEPSTVLDVSFDAEATMRPTTTSDVACPANFAPVMIAAVANPELGTRGTGHKVGPLVRRGGMVERTVPVPAFQSKVEIQVFGCRLKRHFLPVSGRLTVEIDQPGSASYRHVFTNEGGTATRRVITDFRAILMGPEREFGVMYLSDPLIPATKDVVGTLSVGLSRGLGADDMCIDVGTCNYGFGSVAAQLVLTDAG